MTPKKAVQNLRAVLFSSTILLFGLIYLHDAVDPYSMWPDLLEYVSLLISAAGFASVILLPLRWRSRRNDSDVDRAVVWKFSLIAGVDLTVKVISFLVEAGVLALVISAYEGLLIVAASVILLILWPVDWFRK